MDDGDQALGEDLERVRDQGLRKDREPFDANRTPVVRDLDVYMPASAAKPKDRMTVGGVLYSVVGHPEDFNHGPFGFAPGVRVSLLRVEEAG